MFNNIFGRLVKEHVGKVLEGIKYRRGRRTKNIRLFYLFIGQLDGVDVLTLWWRLTCAVFF